jgi:hypothetical protein
MHGASIVAVIRLRCWVRARVGQGPLGRDIGSEMILVGSRCSVGLSVVSASAASSTVRGARYSEVTRGVVVSTVEDVTSTTGTVTGTLIAHGTSSGSQVASEAVPSCSLGLGGPIPGSTITVADRGANLCTSFTGTVYESTLTSTAAA